MRSAPSVSYPVGRCAFHGWLLLLLGAGGLFGGALFCYLSSDPQVWWLVLGGITWMLWSMLAGLTWWRTPDGLLRWAPQRDLSAAMSLGRGWSWQTADGHVQELTAVQWVMDARGVLLLRLIGPDARARWVWLDAGQRPMAWDDVRRALWAHAR